MSEDEAHAALEEVVQALARKVASLEARVQALEAHTAPPTPEEGEVLDRLLRDAQEAYHALDLDTARAKLAEIRPRMHWNTSALMEVQRLEDHVLVIGREERPLDAERWYVGDAGAARGGVLTIYVFWEMYVMYSVRELPKLQALWERWQGRGLRMVAVTRQMRGDPDERVAAFVADEGLTFPVAKVGSRELHDHYRVKGLPDAAITRGARVVWRGHPARITDGLLERLLA